jgi:hypothetical protein
LNSQNNCAPGALTGSGTLDYTASVDTQYMPYVGAFGRIKPAASIIVRLQQSVDDDISHFYNTGVEFYSTGTSEEDFYLSYRSTCRYHRLSFVETDATPASFTTIATISGKQ